MTSLGPSFYACPCLDSFVFIQYLNFPKNATPALQYRYINCCCFPLYPPRRTRRRLAQCPGLVFNTLDKHLIVNMNTIADTVAVKPPKPRAAGFADSARHAASLVPLQRLDSHLHQPVLGLAVRERRDGSNGLLGIVLRQRPSLLDTVALEHQISCLSHRQ